MRMKTTQIYADYITYDMGHAPFDVIRRWSASQSLVTAMTGVDHDQYQLGFLGAGGQTGFAGTKPSRLGIRTFGRLCASMMSVS
jgi:hypothetical protein